jgi:hypothetical protein
VTKGDAASAAPPSLPGQAQDEDFKLMSGPVSDAARRLTVRATSGGVRSKELQIMAAGVNDEVTFRACGECQAGDCDSCSLGAVCCCLQDHPDDSPAMRGFKRFKRMTPEAQVVAVRNALARVREREKAPRPR